MNSLATLQQDPLQCSEDRTSQVKTLLNSPGKQAANAVWSRGAWQLGQASLSARMLTTLDCTSLRVFTVTSMAAANVR